MNKADWVTIAKGELGVKTVSDGERNPRIEQSHSGTHTEGHDDKAAWCSSFLNWNLHQSGYLGTNSALAHSWPEWSTRLKVPCLVA